MALLRVNSVSIECVMGDIADQPGVGAIVNAANARLLPGGGVAGAIHRAAGPGLEKECGPLAPIRPGEAVVTGGHNLPNPYVIHCLGPVYGTDEPAATLLADCYRNALGIAEEKGIRSIAFPAISTGIFGYPVEEATGIALKTVVEETPRLRSVRHIRFVLFGNRDLRVYEQALGKLQAGTPALLIDLDGVLYVGEKAVAGSLETVQWLNGNGIPHLFVTNTSSRPGSALVEKLARFGIHTDEKRIFSPPVAASQWLATHAPGKAALFVPEATKAEFGRLEELDRHAESGASSVVIGDLGKQWTFPVLNRAFRLLMAQPKPLLVALGMTRYWQGTDGLLLDVAPFVKALEHAAGCEAVVLGKPSKAFFDAGLDILGCKPADAIMIGDDIAGDVQGAQRAGMKGILVRTGKFRPGDLEGEIKPDAVLDSIAELPDWWKESVKLP